MKFPDPPVRTQFPDPSGTFFAWGWTKWFETVTNSLTQIFGNPTPEITGSRGGNAAVASLLSSLAAKGIIVDKTTP